MEMNQIRAASRGSVHFHAHGGGGVGPRLADMSSSELADYMQARSEIAALDIQVASAEVKDEHGDTESGRS
jgi:hypothetical protein